MAEKSLYEKLKERQAASKQAEKADKEAAQASAKKPVRDVGMAEDIAKSLGSGIARGITGIAGMGGDIEQLARLETGRLEEAMPEEATAAMPYASLARQVEAIPTRPMVAMDRPTMLPTSEQVYAGAEKIVPEGTLTYRPATGVGRTLQMGGEFFGGSLAPIGKAKTIMGGAALMGGVGTGAGAVGEFSPEAGLAVSLLGGGLTSLLRGKKSGLEKTMADIVGEQTPAKLAEARRLQTAGQEIGVPLTAAETLDSQPLRTLAASVAAHPEGGGILGQFVKDRMSLLRPSITKGLLGVEPVPTELAGTVQRETVEAAKGAVKRAQDIRTQKTTGLYEAAKEQSLEAAPLAAIVKQAKEMKKTVGADTRAEIDRFINRITEVRTVNKKRVRVPITNIGRLESEYRAFRDRINLDPSKIADAPTKEAAATLRGLNKQLDEALLSNENIAEARAIFQEATPEVVKVVDDSGLRAISRLEPDKEDAAIAMIMGEKTTPAKVESLSKSLNAQDKTVMPKIARRWMENATEKALKITVKGEEPLSSGVKFVRSVRGAPDSSQAQSLNKLLEGVAGAKGVNPAQLKEGFNKMLDVLERTNLIDSIGSPTATRGATERMVAENAPFYAKALGMDIAAPAKKISDRLIDAYRAKAYRNIANALVADDSISAIMSMAKTDAGSRQLQGLVANIINPVREISQPMQPEGQEFSGLGLLAQ